MPKRNHFYEAGRGEIVQQNGILSAAPTSC